MFDCLFLIVGCPLCPALEKCEIVICQTFILGGKRVPTTARNCELVCNDIEIVCRQTYNGSLQWTPYNPCTIPTTTTSTSTTTTTSTTSPAPTISRKIFLQPTTPGRRVSTRFLPENIKPIISIVSSEDHNLQKTQGQTYGLSWLVSEPELEIILWIMFSVALLLMLFGIIGIFVFLWYRKRLKRKLKIDSGQRFYDEGHSRTLGIVAYETNPYSGGDEYEKLKHNTGYWVQNPGLNGTVRLTSNPRLHYCQKYGNCQRRISNFSGFDEDQGNLNGPVVQTTYGSSSDGDTYTPVLTSNCKVAAFTPVGTPTISSMRIRDTELHECLEEVLFCHPLVLNHFQSALQIISPYH